MADVYGAPPPGLSGDFYGGHPFGVLAEEVPASGLDGAGYLFPCLAFPADAGKRVRGPITRWPAGNLVVYGNSAFDYLGPTDYALYQLRVQGQASTTDIGYGAGIGRFDLNVGVSSTLSGGATVDDVAPAGSFAGGGGASSLGGDLTLGDAVAAGAIAGAAELTAPPTGRRLASGTRARRLSTRTR